MSRENVEVVRRAYEAFNRGGPEAQLPLIHPDVEFEEPEFFPDRERQHGHDGYLSSFAKVLEIFEVERVEAEELIDVGDDRVIAALYAVGRSKGEGVPGDYRRFEVWTIREGKVARLEFFDSKESALERVFPGARHGAPMGIHVAAGSCREGQATAGRSRRNGGCAQTAPGAGLRRIACSRARPSRPGGAAGCRL
jgi:ketosteroid isomerase-like protein